MEGVNKVSSLGNRTCPPVIKNDYSIKRWTALAKECYMRGCICSGEVFNGVDGQLPKTFTPCPIYKLYFENQKQKGVNEIGSFDYYTCPPLIKCKMKLAVISTVRKLGIPQDTKRNDILKD